MYELTNEKLTQLGAVVTVNEIKQQPKLWQEAFENYQKGVEIYPYQIK